MKVKNFTRVLAGFLPVIFLIVALSAPVVSADSGSSGCGSGGDCSTVENLENVEVDVENLDGFEEKMAVVDAWKNGDTRLLKKELIWKDHCTPRLPGSEARETTLSRNGEVLSQSTIVEIPFKTHGKDVEAQIVHRDDGSVERAYAVVAGTASVLEEPMEILKENAKYQAIVENLENRGFTVKEEEAEVVRTYTPADYETVPETIEERLWKTAVVEVRAIKGENIKTITAYICVNERKVLAVEDGYWDCMANCLAEKVIFQDIQVCYPFIPACIGDPSKVSCGALAACAGGIAGICAGECTAQEYGDDIWDEITDLI
ncbi:MAG: hypothetical protein ACOCTL_00665 [Candidatus Hadarchaeota archaeon]